ncbi:hypothetical protein F5J12DRAFT_835530 [Pisolithus orientalis]|uniref:uncharacterized protein n=1 Tax=Pisolithus orientalis TaxID=936130 RepID=UPI002224F0A4|nr:uncharacterized protein F5J12DRAFT_835530 [Pisolithus orientalis]KAI6005217.1 hypothetical protein F5J12DRAFT_835530 [Pisolithus orientalis]
MMSAPPPDQQDEGCPLLPQRSLRRRRPAVFPAVGRLRDAVAANRDILEFDVHPDERMAFLTLVHIHLYRSCFPPTDRSKDLTSLWTSAKDIASLANDTENRLLVLWSEYLDTNPSLQEIQSVLWSEFPSQPESVQILRVVDSFLADHVPPAFLTQPIIQATMMATWRMGLRCSDDSRHHGWQRFDTLTSPRAIHFLHLLGHLIFVGTLAHYLLYPPSFITSFSYRWYGARETFILVIAASSLVAPWSIYSLSYLLAFLGFLLTLPSAPLPGSLAFSLPAYGPHGPRCFPSLPLSTRTFAPLSTLLIQGTLRILLPTTVFILPALLLASYLVSASLADSTFHPSNLNPAPMDTRASFSLLFLLVIGLFLFASFMSFSAAEMSVVTMGEPWDRYTPAVGKLARKRFYCTVVRYTGHVFFPPFNLLPLPLIILTFVRSMFGYPQAPRVKKVEIIIWRVSVGLLGAVVASIWLWGSV